MFSDKWSKIPCTFCQKEFPSMVMELKVEVDNKNKKARIDFICPTCSIIQTNNNQYIELAKEEYPKAFKMLGIKAV